MLCRVSRLRIDPARIDQGIALVNAHLVPVFEELEGALYGCWMAERRHGEVLGVTCWEDKELMLRSLAEIGELRAMIIDELDALLVGSEVHEIFGMGAAAILDPRSRMYVRAVWVDGLDTVVRGRVEELFATALDRHATNPDFVGAMWLANRESGNGISLTGWRSHDAVAADEVDSVKHRREITRELGCHVTGVSVYEAVSTGISAVGILDLRDPTLREAHQQPAPTRIVSAPASPDREQVAAR